MNDLIKRLKKKLNSVQKTATDKHNNVVYIDVDIFSTTALANMLHVSAATYNSLPPFTFLPMEALDQDKIVDLAFVTALCCQSLIETGKEFQLSDNGIDFIIPTISEMLVSSYGNELGKLLEVYKNEKISQVYEEE